MKAVPPFWLPQKLLMLSIHHFRAKCKKRPGQKTARSAAKKARFAAHIGRGFLRRRKGAANRPVPRL